MSGSFGESRVVTMTGRWSLPRYGPKEMKASQAMSAVVNIRSIVDVLFVDGWMYVPKEWGVMSVACCDSRRAL